MAETDPQTFYLLRLFSADGETIVRELHRDTPAGLGAAAHEILTRGALAELDEDETDTYTGSADGIDYSEVQLGFRRVELHTLSDDEIAELEAEVARLDGQTGADSKLFREPRGRGND